MMILLEDVPSSCVERLNHPDLLEQYTTAFKKKRAEMLKEKNLLSENSPREQIKAFESLCNDTYFELSCLNEQLMEKRS